MPSPQVGSQIPQSLGQLEQSSLPLQRPSPQKVQRPQSAGQLEQVSPPLHTPLPHVSVKVAATEVAEIIVTVHVPVPLQPPPLQPAKVDPVFGVAVKVTMVPWYRD